MQTFDSINVTIAWLTSPVFAMTAAIVCEQFTWFQRLTPLWRWMIQLGMCTAGSLAAYALGHALSPAAAALLDPYLAILLPAISLAANKLAHEADPGAQAGRK